MNDLLKVLDMVDTYPKLIRCFNCGKGKPKVISCPDCKPDERICEYAKSDMTPCYLKDGEVALSNDGYCVGCNIIKGYLDNQKLDEKPKCPSCMLDNPTNKHHKDCTASPENQRKLKPAEKPPESEFTKECRGRLAHILPMNLSGKERKLLEACDRLDKAEAELKEYRAAFGNQGLLQKAETEIELLNQQIKDLKATNQCEWKHSTGYIPNGPDDTDIWFTACDNAFEFTADGPKENHFKHCPYCGGEIVIKALDKPEQSK